MRRSALGGSALVVLAVVCCAGLPLLLAAGLAAGLGAVVLAIVGGVAAGVIGLTAATVAIVLRAHSRRSTCAVPTPSTKELLMHAHECCPPSDSAEPAASHVGSKLGGVPVEVMSFAGCPNREPAVALVERIVDELGVDARIEVIDVTDEETARARRFLGSPTILVAGRDVEPGADARTDYAVSCRVYRTDAGLQGLPDELWLADALIGDP